MQELKNSFAGSNFIQNVTSSVTTLIVSVIE